MPYMPPTLEMQELPHSIMASLLLLFTVRQMLDDSTDPGTRVPACTAPNSCLWVAEATMQDGDGTAKPAIVGCVALESLSAQQAELRRMSVDAKWQRRGIAAQLCRALLAHAKQTGHKEVILTTSEMQQGACKLYEAMGWQEVEQGGLVWPMCYHKFSMAL